MLIVELVRDEISLRRGLLDEILLAVRSVKCRCWRSQRVAVVVE